MEGTLASVPKTGNVGKETPPPKVAGAPVEGPHAPKATGGPPKIVVVEGAHAPKAAEAGTPEEGMGVEPEGARKQGLGGLGLAGTPNEPEAVVVAGPKVKEEVEAGSKGGEEVEGGPAKVEEAVEAGPKVKEEGRDPDLDARFHDLDAECWPEGLADELEEPEAGAKLKPPPLEVGGAAPKLKETLLEVVGGGGGSMPTPDPNPLALAVVA